MAILINGEQPVQEEKKTEKPVEVKIKNLVKKIEKPIEKKVFTKKVDDGKFSMSYSRLRSYLQCPKRFEYHTKYGWNPSPQTKETMRGGKIFEAVVFGDKNGSLN